MSIIPDAIIRKFAPWGNAQLRFRVSGSTLVADPNTGNLTPEDEILDYLAALDIKEPKWTPEKGSDNSVYTVTGRLLYPSILDPRIANGAQAEAMIQGNYGRMELILNLSVDEAHRLAIRQAISGKFRVIGGSGWQGLPTP